HPEHYLKALAMCGNPGRRPLTEAERAAWNEARQQVLGPLKKAYPWEQMYESPLPPELHDTTFITDKGLEFMERHVARAPDTPFFCHISYVDPHNPYNPPAPHSRLFDPDDMADPLPAEWIEQG